MKRKTIAIDIDGTLRDLESQIEKYLEIDHPEKIDRFKELRDDTYRTLDPLFENQSEIFSWLYEQRVFELFGMAGRIHPKVIDDLNIFNTVANSNGYSVIIASVQINQSITSTLHWLSKWGCKVQNYRFFNTMEDKISANYDIYLDDCPLVLNSYANEYIDGISRAIKVPYNFTKDINCPSLDIANGKFDDLYDILNIEKVLKR